MKLRSVACEFVRYKIGNGQPVWCWFDNWHPSQPLMTRFRIRIAYDAASRITERMKDYIDANGWVLRRAISNDLIQVVNQWPRYSRIWRGRAKLLGYFQKM